MFTQILPTISKTEGNQDGRLDKQTVPHPYNGISFKYSKIPAIKL